MDASRACHCPPHVLVLLLIAIVVVGVRCCGTCFYFVPVVIKSYK